MYDAKFRALMQEIYLFNFKLSLFHKITGESPFRCFELPLAVRNLSTERGKNLLDIGSSKSCFPSFMAKKGAIVTCLDYAERTMVQMRYAKKVGIINHTIDVGFNIIDNPKIKIRDKVYTSPDGNFNIVVCDARKTDIPDESFDAISCISAIEHVPNDGDIIVIKEIRRILKCNGKAFISVPYGQYEEKKSHGGHFERIYDYEAINERLIQPSDLKVVNVGFIFDRKSRKLINLVYYKLPSYMRYLLGWTFIPLLISKYLSKSDNANKNDAALAYIVLKRDDDE